MPAHSFQSFVSFAALSALNRSSRPAIVNSTGRQIARRRRPLRTPPRPRCPRTSIYKYVRRVRGWKYQARVYQRNLDNNYSEHVNLGLYESEIEAWQAVRDFVRTGERPAHLLPKYIYRAGYDPPQFVGRLKLRGSPIIRTPRSYGTPAEADRAMRRLLVEMFGSDGLVRFYPFG